MSADDRRRASWTARLFQVPPARLALALALGTAGGVLFDALGLPLAWMLGAMTASTVCALGGLPVAMDQRLRKGMVAVLGVMIGSAFTPDLAGRLPQWGPSLIGLAVYTLTAVLVSGAYFRRIAKYDPITAHFSAVPGGVTEMTLVGGAMGADDRTISLSHGLRILVTVFVIPFWFSYFEGFDGAGQAIAEPLRGLSGRDALVMAACALAGAPLAARLRIPAAYLTGPLILSAIVHLAGATEARPPDTLVAVAQVVLGTAIGCRFAGVELGRVMHTLRHGLAAVVLLLGLTFLFGTGLAALTGLERKALFLAFAPGGVTEMSLIALALGIDLAYVSTHHLARILMVVVLAPLSFRLLGKRGKAEPIE